MLKWCSDRYCLRLTPPANTYHTSSCFVLSSLRRNASFVASLLSPLRSFSSLPVRLRLRLTIYASRLAVARTVMSSGFSTMNRW